MAINPEKTDETTKKIHRSISPSSSRSLYKRAYLHKYNIVGIIILFRMEIKSIMIEETHRKGERPRKKNEVDQEIKSILVRFIMRIERSQENIERIMITEFDN